MSKVLQVTCANCGDVNNISAAEYRQNFKNRRYFCCGECRMEYAEDNQTAKQKPWQFLHVKTVLDNLPHWEEPQDLYVGY